MRFFNNLMAGMFDDIPWTQNSTELLDGDVLSDILPWRSYEEDTGFYHFAHGSGFLMEIGPPLSDEGFASNIGGVLTASLPAGASFQVLNWASPSIGKVVGNWRRAREGRSALVREMADQRAAWLHSLRFGMQDKGPRAIPFDRHIYIAAWMEGDDSLEMTRRLGSLRNALEGCIVSASWYANVPPAQFLDLLREIFHIDRPDRAGGDSGGDIDMAGFGYDENMPLNFQLAGASINVGAQALRFSGRPDMAATVSSVSSWPPEWLFALGDALNGDTTRLMSRPLGPVLTSFIMKAMSQQKASAFLLRKRGMAEHASSSSFGKFIPDFASKKAEIDALSTEVEAGERLYQTLYTVVSYAQGGTDEAQQAASETEAIYRRQRIRMSRDTFLQMPLFLASLPFCCSDAMMKDFGRQMRMRLLKSTAAMGFLPVHGEWSGNARGPGLLLLGRQGQVFQWDNFESTGNYNTCVIGKSGAGKSVLMQELATSIFTAGGHVLIIDDGYSFKTTADILEGRHIAFDGDTRNRLNPFSLLDGDAMTQDEYRADAIELVTRVIASMADLGHNNSSRVEGVEEDYIRRAIGEVWDRNGPSGEITDVRDRLIAMAEAEPRLPDVIRKLDNYSRGGVYGSYFEGPANISLDAPFTVVEMSDIKGQHGLESTILQIVMFLGTELMFKTPRGTPVGIVIDEAWDLLKGEGTAPFIEGVVRRARKYTGALITGTQSIKDYYANPAAQVCLENSDYRVFMAQKPESLMAMEGVPASVKAQIRSLTSVRGRFSEMAIQGPEGYAYGRLLLDPFSLAIFSSTGTTVERMQRYKAGGMSTVEAIRAMVAEGEVR